MVFRALLTLTLVLSLTQALPIKKANDLSQEIADVANENIQKRSVKRSQELLGVGNHQNKPRLKKADPAVELKNEQNRDENGKIEVVSENEIEKSDVPNSNSDESTPTETGAMEQAVVDLANVAKDVADDTADDSNDSDLEEKVKVIEEEKELEKIPKDGKIVEETETKEDEVLEPNEAFKVDEPEDVNSIEVPEEGEVDDSEEMSSEDVMNNIDVAPQRPAVTDYQYDDYNGLYADPYQWLDRKKRDADRKKRESTLQGAEAGMSMVVNEDAKSRSKRDTQYPLSLRDLYNLYVKYQIIKDQDEPEEEDVEPVYELPEYEEDYDNSPEYDYGGADVAPPSEDWEPDAVNEEIQKELAYEAMMQPALEAEAPYALENDLAEEDEDEDIDDDDEVPAWEVPAEPAYYPMEYVPISNPSEEDEIYVPDKRAELLSMMPGIKRAEKSFYPAYTEDQEPWQALIPPAAEKRGVMEEYARLYRLARALKRSRDEDALEGRWESLIGDYDEKKK